MNKEFIKEQWGGYCDTDRLVDEMSEVFRRNNRRCSEHGVCKMLNKFFTNKRALIDMFARSPRYIGEMRIAMDVEMDRKINQNEVRNFCQTFLPYMNADKILCKKLDANGKSRNDYLNEVDNFLSPADFANKKTQKKLTEVNSKVNAFSPNGFTTDSEEAQNILKRMFEYVFGNCASSTVSETVIAKADLLPTPVKLARGMHTSRAFNRVCNKYGIDVLPEYKGNTYNKLFAKYADMVSPLKRKLKFFISINPIDYLLMSNGVSWTSCHSIVNGGWAGGTVSYMLDSTSFVTFVSPETPVGFITEKKLYREMFHYCNGNLIQGRVYPQENDGAQSLYDFFGELVCKELAEVLGRENIWARRTTNNEDHQTFGVNYKDYATHTTQAHYQLEGHPQYTIRIGHIRICPYCGRDIANNELHSSSIAHTNCELV